MRWIAIAAVMVASCKSDHGHDLCAPSLAALDQISSELKRRDAIADDLKRCTELGGMADFARGVYAGLRAVRPEKPTTEAWDASDTAVNAVAGVIDTLAVSPWSSYATCLNAVVGAADPLTSCAPCRAACTRNAQLVQAVQAMADSMQQGIVKACGK